MARTVSGSDDDSKPRRRRRAAERPTQLPGGSWRAALKSTVREFRIDALNDWAAALTYYSVLSIFPALLVLVSLVGLAGQETIQGLVDNLGQVAPSSVNDILKTAIQNLQRSQGSAGVLTVVVMILLAASAIVVVVTGGLAQRVGRLLGIGSAAVTAWDIAKWPVLLVVVSFLFALLYWASPNARQGFRWVTPGGTLAVVVWVAVSIGFALYVANFGSYNKTYGSLAGVIVFLVWLWLSNTAILLGAELNAELERRRAIAGGHPADAEPYMELRDSSRIRERDDL